MDITRFRTRRRLSTLENWVERPTRFGGKEYQVHVSSFSCLSPEHFYESDLFELGGSGGYRWKLVIYREHRGFEGVKLSLVSCNNCGIRARIGWSIESRSPGHEISLPNAAKATVPFSIIDRQYIALSDLTDSLETLDFELIVKVRISNIEQINRDELRRENKDVRSVRLEIIDTDTLREWAENNKLGLVPPTRKLRSYVYHDSLLCFWGADDSLNDRYWLCMHRENGNLIVEKCLDAFSLWKSFGDFSYDIDGGIPWVTLFREEKKNGDCFQPIDDDSIIVFCKQLDLSGGSATYLGHLICEKNKSCQDLSKAVEQTMICTTYEESYQYYVLIDNRCYPMDITELQRTLGQCGFKSGSTVLIMGPDPDGDFLNAETLQIFGRNLRQENFTLELHFGSPIAGSETTADSEARGTQGTTAGSEERGTQGTTAGSEERGTQGTTADSEARGTQVPTADSVRSLDDLITGEIVSCSMFPRSEHHPSPLGLNQVSSQFNVV